MSPFMINSRGYLVLTRLSLALCLLFIFLIFALGDLSLATGSLNFASPLDKVLHMIVYASIAGLLMFSRAVRSVLLVWILVVGVGVLDEWHQLSIAGREAGLADLLADAIGAGLGIWITRLIMQNIFVKADV